MANLDYVIIKTVADCGFENLPPIEERVEKFLQLLGEKNSSQNGFSMKQLQLADLIEFFYLFLLLFNVGHNHDYSSKVFKDMLKQKTQMDAVRYKDFKNMEISNVFGWLRASEILGCSLTLFRQIHNRDPKAFLEFYYKVIDPLFFSGKRERDALEKIKKQAFGFIITP